MMKIKLNERAGVTVCLNPTPEIKYINVTRMVVVCCGGRGAFTLRIQRLPIDGLKISCSFLFCFCLFSLTVNVCVCVCLFRMAFHWDVLSTHCYGCVHFIVIILGKHFQ